MKTLIIGAGPLGMLYAYRLHRANKDVTLLARGPQKEFIRERGVVLLEEFSQEQLSAPVKVMDRSALDQDFDLAVVIMRKNSILKLLPELKRAEGIKNFLFLGNNGIGFDEYLQYLPTEKVLFGFPGGGGSRIDHVAHFVDREKPGADRMPMTIGEIDGKVRTRTEKIRKLFVDSEIPVKVVDHIDSWLKYHLAFVLPLAGAIIKAGDNYKLAENKRVLKEYIRAVREAGRVLKSIGYLKSYNFKFNLFYIFPAVILSGILSKVFSSKFAEVAMMMHINAAGDEMGHLVTEFERLEVLSAEPTEHLDELFGQILSYSEQERVPAV